MFILWQANLDVERPPPVLWIEHSVFWNSNVAQLETVASVNCKLLDGLPGSYVSLQHPPRGQLEISQIGRPSTGWLVVPQCSEKLLVNQNPPTAILRNGYQLMMVCPGWQCGIIINKKPEMCQLISHANSCSSYARRSCYFTRFPTAWQLEAPTL